MYADFIFLMSHGTVRNLSNHAYGGMALFALFVVHHILNGWFYKTVTKGKYNVQRILLSTTRLGSYGTYDFDGSKFSFCNRSSF